MDTTYINNNDEPRFITKFEKESLADYYFNEGDIENPSVEGFENWVEELNWNEVDEIMSHYTK